MDVTGRRVLSIRRARKLAALRDATWIAGCERCRSHLLSLCADEGFEPRIGYTSDDMVVMRALVVAGLGVTTIPQNEELLALSHQILEPTRQVHAIAVALPALPAPTRPPQSDLPS